MKFVVILLLILFIFCILYYVYQTPSTMLRMSAEFSRSPTMLRSNISGSLQTPSTSIGSFNENFEQNNIEMVISRYNENLDWLKDEPFNEYSYIVYNKGTNENFYKSSNLKRVVNTKNVGRCDHTYLYHIIQNYDNLADITIFLPGSVSLGAKLPKARELLNQIKNKKSAVFANTSRFNNVKAELYDFTLDSWAATDSSNLELNPESELELSKIRPFGKWFENKFGDIVITHVVLQAIFSVAKKDILQHSKQYYENLITGLSNSSNPEEGHYFERSWEAVFYPMNHTIFA